MTDVAATGPDGVAVDIVRDAAAMIISVSEEITDVLGWLPSEFVGHPSTDFIHPEDQPSAIAAWFEMIDTPGETRTWQGRYRTSDGAWKWVTCVNFSMLDDSENSVVKTTMRPVTVDQVSVAEELRARKQLLSRLSDAMPIGMFQIDTDRAVTFTTIGCTRSLATRRPRRSTRSSRSLTTTTAPSWTRRWTPSWPTKQSMTSNSVS